MALNSDNMKGGAISTPKVVFPLQIGLPPMVAQGKSNRARMLESKKSHSWWWDSHVSTKSSKWLQDNLEEMDQNVKRMLKLIEEDGDSFAKKAEMYYQKRPELISLVEEFYRMYRSLAERYDHVTGELRRNIPSDLQSQGSGISEVTSEPPSICPSPDLRPSRRRSGPRAAGFDFFLGTGGNSSESGYREGYESSTMDSEPESDDSSVINYSGVQSNDDDQVLRRKIIELEVELRDAKEKLRMQQEDLSECPSTESRNGNIEIILSRLATHEEELRDVKEKLQLSEEEVNRLQKELQRFESMDTSEHARGELNTTEKDLDVEKNLVGELQGVITGSGMDLKILALEEELKDTKDKLSDSEKEVARLWQELKKSQTSEQILQGQLGTAKKDAASWKTKLDREGREVSKLQDRISRYKSNLSDRDQEIRRLKESIANANKSLSEENLQLQAELTKLQKERSYLENNLKELDVRCQTLEEDVRRVLAGKSVMEASLGAEIEQLEVAISERNDQVSELTVRLNAITQDYNTLMAEKGKLDAKFEELTAEASSKDDRIDAMHQHMHQLHMEQVKLMTETKGAHKQVEELRLRVRELEEEVERQKEVIQVAAEEKREAIRQLCVSIEHYRNGYHRLREVVISHKRYPVAAA